MPRFAHEPTRRGELGPLIILTSVSIVIWELDRMKPQFGKLVLLKSADHDNILANTELKILNDSRILLPSRNGTSAFVSTRGALPKWQLC